jgi:hypothetical protein
MKLLLEVKDNKADFILELLQQFDYVKVILVETVDSSVVAEPAAEYEKPTDKTKKSRKERKKEKFLNELREAVEQVNLHKQGKIKLKSAQELLDEL